MNIWQLLLKPVKHSWLFLVLCLLLVAGPAHVGAQTPPPSPRLIREHTIGTSPMGHPITALQIGQGPRKLVVVGDTHGGPEANTYHLTLELIEYFMAHPEEVPPEVRLYFIPTINPDGLALGRRFNAAGVDLNRNMQTTLDACPENDWRVTVNGAYGIVSNTGGPYADSEVESRVLRHFLLDASGAIFLHSNAGLVFPAFCEHEPSLAMAQTYAFAAGYEYRRFWDRYLITGSMPDWASSIGIAAITPELYSPLDTEFPQNLAGLKAVMNLPEHLLPLPTGQHVAGFEVPALLWRYWVTHGGESVIGIPLEPARPTADGIVQTFTNMRLQVRFSQADTPYLVQPTLLGSERLQAMGHSWQATAQEPGAGDGEVVSFDQTEYVLYGAFLDYWKRNGGLLAFGLPITGEFETTTADGQRRTVQYFERAVFAYYPETNRVRLEPLGWQTLLLEQMQQATSTPQVR